MEIETSQAKYPRLLRPEEVAETLNISKSLAYRLLQQGQIPTVRFNRTVRVRQMDLEAYIQQCLNGRFVK